MRIKRADPKAFEEMKAGKSSANQAECGKPKSGFAAEQYEKALARIEEVCGKSQANGIREGAILRNRKDVVAYAELPNDNMLAIRALVDQGWSVKKAVHYKAEKLWPTHNLRAAMERAVAENGSYKQEVHDENQGLVCLFEVTVLQGKATAARKAKRNARAQKRAERLNARFSH